MLKLSQKSNDKVDKLERIYEKYKYAMLREAYKILLDQHLAEDAVQQSFIKIFKNIDKIEEENEGRTYNFLKIICTNVAKDIYNERIYLNTSDNPFDYLDENEELIVAGPSEYVIDSEAVAKIEKAIENLPPIYKEVIMLEKLQCHSRHEIMKLLNISEEALQKRITRAKSKLKEALGKEMPKK